MIPCFARRSLTHLLFQKYREGEGFPISTPRGKIRGVGSCTGLHKILIKFLKAIFKVDLSVCIPILNK